MTTLTEPFWMMYHEVPSSPWLNTAWTIKQYQRHNSTPTHTVTGFHIDSNLMTSQQRTNISSWFQETYRKWESCWSEAAPQYWIYFLWDYEIIMRAVSPAHTPNPIPTNKNVLKIHIHIYKYLYPRKTNGYLHTVPALAWDSKITTLASSLFTCTAVRV